MSTELFLNTNRRLSKQQHLKIKECFKENNVRDVNFRYIGKGSLSYRTSFLYAVVGKNSRQFFCKIFVKYPNKRLVTFQL